MECPETTGTGSAEGSGDYSVGRIKAELFVSRLVYRMAVNNKHTIIYTEYNTLYSAICIPLLLQDKSYRQYKWLVQSYVIKVRLKSNRLLVLNIVLKVSRWVLLAFCVALLR